MKAKYKALLAAALLPAFGALSASGQTADGVRNIKINEDRDQRWFVTKVYELKNIKANDITPWLLGAVQRYNTGSVVNGVNYDGGKRQFIVVTTGKDMIPYVDQIVSSLDRPSSVKNELNSIVDGTGISYASYRPLYRGSNDIIQNVVRDTRGWGWGWFDDNNGVYYWKDNKSHAALVKKWLEAFDRPVPQAEVSVNVYEVVDSDFRELGFDIAQWKDGPGNSLFGIGFDFTKYKSSEQAATQVLGSSSGFIFAPQFDASFIKLLQEKGKARSASSSRLTLVNDYASTSADKYKIVFSPSYQNITKNENRILLLQQNTKTNLTLSVKGPQIAFGEQGDKAGNLKATFILSVSEHIDSTNSTTDSSGGAADSNANLAWNYHNFQTSTRIAAGSEKLIASYSKDHKVTEDIGLPYLKEIPILKYLVAETAESVIHSTVFVTVRVEPIANQNDVLGWAGKAIDEAALAQNALKN